MRDLRTYPITDDEIIQYLERLQQEISDSYVGGDLPIGSTDGVIVGELIARTKAEGSLRTDCAKWVKYNEISSLKNLKMDSVGMPDSVQDTLCELVKIVCQHVGYYKE